MSVDASEPIAEIDRILGDDPACDVAKNIAKNIVALPPSQAKYISYSQLAKFGDVEPADGRLLQCVATLTSGRVHLLNVFYVYENVNGEEYKISPEQLQEAHRHGFLVDPDSGEAVKDFRKHLYPYFERSN